MSYKLLVVDDNRGCADLYKIRFEFDGWEVKIAYSAEEARDMLFKGDYHPDAITLDLMLPEMQGGELLEILRADPRTKDIPIAVLTILRLDSDNEGLRSGLADDYIRKMDINPKELVQRMTKLVEKKKPSANAAK